MAKGQLRSNKEARKPKTKLPKKTHGLQSSAKPGFIETSR